MPANTSALLVICISVALCASTLGSPILDDLFRGFIRDGQLANEPPKDSAVVKRRIYEENPDGQLKQVSLQSLIGDVENSLFQTALSVSSVAHNDRAVVPEVKPNSNDPTDRSITKRETEETSDIATHSGRIGEISTTSEYGDSVTESNGILLQTTQKVPASNGVPAHILIDRVAVQPHEGGLPIIPAFQVYHTKVISATFKEPHSGSSVDGVNGNAGGSTKISIAQTAVQATNAGTLPVITIATTKQNGNPEIHVATATTTLDDNEPTTAPTTLHSIQQENTEKAISTDSTIRIGSSEIITDKIETTTSTSTSTTASTTTSTTTPSTTTPTTSSTAAPTTTKLPIVQLKEAEEELKEKVAEIEAEPIILSARV